MSNKKYWSSLDEMNETAAYKEQAAQEFPVEITADEVLEKDPNRRDFLKAMGFSITAAVIASSCKIRTNKSIPYTFDGRKAASEVVPGVAEYFATTYVENGDFCNILVKTREGRPIKIEGNNDSPLTKGGTNARVQASIIGLYDVSRLPNPTKANKKITWEQADSEITTALSKIANSGGKIALVSNTINSIATKKAIDKFKAKYPTTTHVEYDAVSNYAIRKANQLSIGNAIIPSYNFEKAEVIVGFNCDFLGTWLATTENAKKYIINRVPSKENPKMSRHHQFQSTMTITGAAADYRYPIKPSEEKQALQNLYVAIGGSGSKKAISDKKTNEGIDKVAKDLLVAKGKSLIVSSTNDVQVQLLVNAINGLLGNYGNTIDTANTYNLKNGNDEQLVTLANDLKAGGYKAIVLLGANPVYNTPYAEIFKNAIEKAELSVSLNDRADESSQFAQYICPTSHYLESWDIVEPKKGFYSFIQPTINTLFDTRQATETLLKLAGDNTAIADFVQAEVNAVGGSLENGFIQQTIGSAGASVSTASLQLGNEVAPKGLEVFLYEKVGLGDGTNANNPYLQEMPDPIAKATWDNYVCIPYSFAVEKGIEAMPPDKKVPMAKVTVNGKSITLPVVVQFGQAQGTLAIALGYGRTNSGKAGDGVGQNVYPFIKTNNNITSYSIDNASFELVGKKYELALNQTYHTLMEEDGLFNKPKRYRGQIVKETTLKDYQKNETAGNEDREEIKQHLVSLYDAYSPQDYSQGHHWGMVVDLNSCIGCGACVVGCNIENNVPVVGKRQVFRSQEMHWMRIDRYYNGDPDNPDVSFQPMMCQHCDNAPCENVCPVNATNHSSEGLNQMAYNRCIGTRYCANNCPFKVRRFNWLDYQGADSFGTFNDQKMSFGDNGGATYMTEDLSRMILNPDVNVRSRGVIEKCSFCVQRIQDGKLAAKKENRLLVDGDIKSACQSACPTNAITFGDQNDKKSAVHNKFMNDGRNYFLFEEQHFLPSVGYQVKVRNKDEERAKGFIEKEI